ncbi:2,3-diaminopropionate biosynthesis protein SbnB [Pendulispora brunnea]|uniref:2,3-diaminopropionate biosynthesis protein SbnB n=1 Tax=Pendulispora brunnea TaxID=2905690 RepID=A0ABZ2KA40_9BACT
MNFEFKVISGAIAHEIIHSNYEMCQTIIAEAYRQYADGKASAPTCHFLRFPDRPNARIIPLPARIAMGDHCISGIKWIASYPDNVAKGIPRASAVLILNDEETGYPLACVEASLISAARTAASATLGAHHLARGKRRAKSLGIVGNGIISKYIYQFLIGTGWEIDEVRLFDKNPAEPERFHKNVIQDRRHRVVTHTGDLESLLVASDLIVFATSAGAPHITDKELFAHNPIVLHISLRDLGADIIAGAQNFVDSAEHALSNNTSLHLAQMEMGHADFLTGTISDLIEGRRVADPERLRIFSPFGLGVLDLALGNLVYRRAVETRRFVAVDDFFYERER